MWKKTVFKILRFSLPVAIIAWLLYSVDEQQLQDLQSREKDWGQLSVAYLIALTATCLTFVRWYILVRALDLQFRLKDAFRLGFLGYLFNFVSIGVVGGDLFKAIFIAHEQPGKRPEAVATVVVDRVIGLYGLLVLTTITILVNGIHYLGGSPNGDLDVTMICRSTLFATTVGTIGLIAVLIPRVTQSPLIRWVGSLPKIGGILERLIDAVQMYRLRAPILLGSCVMSVATHAMFVISIYLIATALYPQTPSIGAHFIIAPLANAAAALPFTPGGLGVYEATMDALYHIIPGEGNASIVSGFIVALAFRFVTILVAAFGAIVYWTSRREVKELMRQP
ncbi:MAG: flippase-like domain-containing protein [Pirellulaceae bacterium]|nr:flippase-like domain-containing protein [Pirellulaceae bacterium]